MARYLSQIVYTAEDGAGALFEVPSDRPLSLEEMAYLKLVEEFGGATDDDGQPISQEHIDDWVATFSPFGPDNVDLAQAQLEPARDVVIPAWVRGQESPERWQGEPIVKVAVLTNPGDSLGLGDTIFAFSDVARAEAWFLEKVGLPFSTFDRIRDRVYHGEATDEELDAWDKTGLGDPADYFDVGLAEVEVL